CHAPPPRDAALEAAWIARWRPEFERLGAQAPTELTEIYPSFIVNAPMRALLTEVRPRVVSFHFGLPPAHVLENLRQAGSVLLGSATSLPEALQLQAAGLHAVIAQGYEAGGHRGRLDPDAPDERLGVLPLTRLLVKRLRIPVIAAGGIMDGAGIAAALALGASAVQLGTAFIDCPESQADAGFRAALKSEAAHHTLMTRVISGRPARCLANRFTRLGAAVPASAVPAYPVPYDLGKALHAAGMRSGEFGYGAQWAGQGAPLARSLPAADLVRALAQEMR
ncbi:MAG: nitronate monooxygenase, partial [Gammaproteobacteria bacterium]|nr:nitronate monooxygenase [Gammaproteobacteria bacterium]